MKRPRVLAIASRGGHWTQLRRLRDAFDGCDVTWASTDPGFAAEVAPQRFVCVPEATRWDRIKLVWSLLRVGFLVASLRPHCIVSTGAAPGFFALRIGKIFGARTLWIDSIANAETLSLSGAKASRFATLTLTQWPELGPALESAPSQTGNDNGKKTVYHAGAVL